MSTNTKQALGAVTAITCTMASKASGNGRRSAIVDNTSTAYLDALVQVALKTGTVSAGSYFTLYAYASLDNSLFDTGGGTDADWNTLRGDEKLIDNVECPSSSTVYSGTFSIAKAFGGFGSLPPYWGIILFQTNCGTISAVEADHTKQYRGIYLVSA